MLAMIPIDKKTSNPFVNNLIEWARAGDIDKINEFTPTILELEPNTLLSAIQAASSYNQKDCIPLLTSLLIHTCHQNAASALFLAAEKGCFPAVECLLSLNIAEQPIKTGFLLFKRSLFPIEIAAQNKHWDIVISLLNKARQKLITGVYLNTINNVLEIAAQNNNWELVTTLLNIPFLTSTANYQQAVANVLNIAVKMAIKEKAENPDSSLTKDYLARVASLLLEKEIRAPQFSGELIKHAAEKNIWEIVIMIAQHHPLSQPESDPRHRDYQDALKIALRGEGSLCPAALASLLNAGTGPNWEVPVAAYNGHCAYEPVCGITIAAYCGFWEGVEIIAKYRPLDPKNIEKARAGKFVTEGRLIHDYKATLLTAIHALQPHTVTALLYCGKELLTIDECQAEVMKLLTRQWDTAREQDIENASQVIFILSRALYRSQATNEIYETCRTAAIFKKNIKFINCIERAWDQPESTWRFMQTPDRSLLEDASEVIQPMMRRVLGQSQGNDNNTHLEMGVIHGDDPTTTLDENEFISQDGAQQTPPPAQAMYYRLFGQHQNNDAEIRAMFCDEVNQPTDKTTDREMMIIQPSTNSGLR